MIKVKLIGGLGNQLFQIAYAYDLSKKLGHNIIVDASQYKTYKIRSLEIDKLFISQHLEFDYVGKDRKFNITSVAYRVIQKLIKSFYRRSDFGKIIFRTLSKCGCLYNFDPHFYNLGLNFSKNEKIYIYGYFQSEYYFDATKKDIKRFFKVNLDVSPLENKYLSIIKSKPNIAMSMRLGDDYYNCDILNVCNESYYINALREMVGKTDAENIIVFSDDIQRAKKVLENEPYHFVFIENVNAIQSLRLMYSCDNFVIANSSFSWWGAYLSDNKDKKIIAPSRWYNYDNNVNDIYCMDMGIL
ncbi:alpha-1,2-fucosyltransferase [Vibrio fluvialis]|nr:alpha-1,2-fucosyltransferase [Vibrio fluvialis]